MSSKSIRIGRVRMGLTPQDVARRCSMLLSGVHGDADPRRASKVIDVVARAVARGTARSWSGG